MCFWARSSVLTFVQSPFVPQGPAHSLRFVLGRPAPLIYYLSSCFLLFCHCMPYFVLSSMNERIEVNWWHSTITIIPQWKARNFNSHYRIFWWLKYTQNLNHAVKCKNTYRNEWMHAMNLGMQVFNATRWTTPMFTSKPDSVTNRWCSVRDCVT